MLLDIELIKAHDMFCEESVLASIACWKKRNYQMMFTCMLGFDFDIDVANQDNRMGCHLSCGFIKHDMSEMEKYYHGVSEELHKIDCINHLSEIILEELKKGMPVGLCIDYSYCNWNSKAKHAFLFIIGYDEDMFYCYDVHDNEKNKKSIAISAIDAYGRENNDIRYNTYSIVGEEKKNLSFHTFVQCIENSNYMKQNSYNKMLQMADFIESRLDLERELTEEDILKCPIFVALCDIARGRRLLGLSLDYLYSIDHDPQNINCKEDLMSLAVAWKDVFLKIYRYCLLKIWEDENKYKLCVKSIADDIRRIAHTEHEIFSDLYKNSGHVHNKVILYTKKKMLTWKTAQEVEITQYYNNKAFQSVDDTIMKADISGLSEYFLSNSEEISVNVYGNTFVMKIPQSGCDNISCTGQEITFNPMRCNKFLCVSLAEWGTCSTKMKVYTTNQGCISLDLKIDDWYESTLKDETVWIGKANTVNGIEKRGIYGYIYEFDNEVEISKIELPIKSNLHIFKIYAIE